MDHLRIVPYDHSSFEDVIKLGNLVHGDNYLNPESAEEIYLKGLKDGLNASCVCYIDDKLVGFRLTYAPGNWELDKWCSPEEWHTDRDAVCYFKCNTVDESLRGKGIGSKLLQHSIAIAKQQGAKAGVSHIWLQSPGNSAFKYMTKAGGELVKEHPGKWGDLDYDCPICGIGCKCVAAEMIVHFEK